MTISEPSAAPRDVSDEAPPPEHSTLRLSGKADELAHLKLDTRAVRGGYRPSEWSTDPYGRSVVNVPVYHASTITFPDMKTLRFAASDWPFTGMWYGRHGNPTTFALEEAFAVLEGATNACLTSSGVAAVNVAILAFVKAGDHVLISDAAYDPTRDFADKFLARFGVTTTYFSPTISAPEFEQLLSHHKNTTAVLVETPASLSFELTDVQPLADIAHSAGAHVIADNTWGPTLFRPFEHGVDVSVNAATKYIGGHSDLMMGIVSAKDPEIYRRVKNSLVQLGCPPGPDDAYLALRGLRTLRVRLKHHGTSGLRIARWLADRPEVARVMHPALASPELFEKYFTGASGLFGFQLNKGYSQEAIDAMLDGMKLHALGFSWGGFESLLMQTKINAVRSVDTWNYVDYGQTMRIHVGLEDCDDLIADLADGFARLEAFK